MVEEQTNMVLKQKTRVVLTTKRERIAMIDKTSVMPNLKVVVKHIVLDLKRVTILLENHLRVEVCGRKGMLI